MDLSNLKPAEGATHSEQRLGRGEGSGRGAHSSTRGTKGQSSRSGAKNRPIWFEGGQTPLFRRVPKHGFNSPFPTEYSTVNVGRIQRLIDEGRIDPDDPVTPEVLEDVGAIRDAGNVKILGDGALDAAIEASSHAYSGTAQEKIEDAGGTASVVEESS